MLRGHADAASSGMWHKARSGMWHKEGSGAGAGVGAVAGVERPTDRTVETLPGKVNALTPQSKAGQHSHTHTV